MYLFSFSSTRAADVTVRFPKRSTNQVNLAMPLNAGKPKSGFREPPENHKDDDEKLGQYRWKKIKSKAGKLNLSMLYLVKGIVK